MDPSKGMTQENDRDRFDKFTERARKVLSLAQEEAQRFNHNYIGTEHLLLGLVREGEGVAAKVLSNLGVELNKVRSAVEFIIGRGDRIVLEEIGLTPRTKKVLELAVDEAHRMNHHYIGTEHLLLGLVREGKGIAAGVLESLGVTLEQARAQTVLVHRQDSGIDTNVTAGAHAERPDPSIGRAPASGKQEAKGQTAPAPSLQHRSSKRGHSKPEVGPLIRLFISSTFADFEFEREVLQGAVFPQLRKLCAAAGCRFQPIDLRWGVSQEAGNDKRTLAICLEEVARCQRLSPDLNFLILLGERYGSCFLPEHIPSEQVARLWPHLSEAMHERFSAAYAEDHNALPPVYVLLPGRETANTLEAEEALRVALAEATAAAGFPEQERLPFAASATHLEIQRGLLDGACDPRATLCAFRSFPSELDAAQAAKYGEPHPGRQEQLTALKRAIEQRLSEDHVWRYTVPVESLALPQDQDARETSQAYQDLEKQFRALLEPRIQEALARRKPTAHTRTPAALVNRQFATARASVVVGREDSLARVTAYLSGSTSLPLVVMGESGVGKSTLLARVVQDAAQAYPRAVVITRYIGVSPETSSLADLLAGVRSEIAQRYGEAPPVPLGDLSQLVAAVAGQLRTQSVPVERPLILIVDALDQLEGQQQRMDWLPPTLAPQVRVVVSTRSDRSELAPLPTWLPLEQVLWLGPLTRAKGEEALRQWLTAEGRRLTPAQEKVVLDGFAPVGDNREGTGAPLYLRLAFEQARAWRSFDPVEPLPPTASALLQRYFRRLEQRGQHGRKLVAYALGYIAAAKHGLAEDELLDVLSRNPTIRKALHRLSPGSPPVAAERPLPMALWTRLAADLERTLTEREADGARLVTFYHQQVREEAERRYLGATMRPARHAELTAYFGKQPYQQGPDGGGTWNRRKLAELAYQQAGMGAGGRLALGTTLTDGGFLEGKLAVEGVVATLDDLARAPDDETSATLAQVIRAGADILSKDPSDLPNQITGRVGQVARLHDLPVRPTPWLRLRTQSLAQASSALLHVFLGHRSTVTSCALSKDGRVALSASYDKTLRLWDTITGECLRVFVGHSDTVTSCALSADGCLALSASTDGTVRAWNTMSGQVLQSSSTPVQGTGITASGASCALSADGQVALSASEKRTLQVWNPTSGETLCLLKAPGFGRVEEDHVTHCALSADGKVAFAAFKDMALRVWDTSSGQMRRELRIHRFPPTLDEVKDATLSADGHLVLFSRIIFLPKIGISLYVWDWSSDQPPRRLGRYADPDGEIRHALSADGRRALVAWKNDTLHLWDTTRRHCLLVFENQGGHGCTLSADGRRALSASDNTLRLWDITTSSAQAPRLQRPSFDRRFSYSCALSWNGRRLLTVGSSRYYFNEKAVRLWDISPDQVGIRGVQLLRTLRGPIWIPGRGTMSADGRRALVASVDKLKLALFWRVLRLWDTKKGKTLRVFRGHTDRVVDCALSADGHLALSASHNSLLLWETTSGRRLYKLYPQEPGPTFREVWRDALEVVHGGYKPKMKFNPGVTRCALSADGRRACSVTKEGERVVKDVALWFWDTVSGHCLQVVHGCHTDVVTCCALSADGRLALSGSRDKTLRLWETASGQLLHDLKGNGGRVISCALSADGHLALSASIDRTLRLWNTSSGQEIARWTPDEEIHACALSADGQTAVACAGDVIHILEVVGVTRTGEPPPAQPPVSWLAEQQPHKPGLVRRLFGRT